jgi:hypothetical protein
MADLSGGYTFVDGSGALTAARLNALIGSATILPAFITGKSSITPDVADSIVFYDTSGTVLGKCTITALITAMQGTSSGKLAAGNDSRFSASVTGLRLGAGAGADTAAKAKDLAFAPTIAVPTAGAVTCNCALNNLFTIDFIVNTTVTLTNISDGDQICLQITQKGAVGSYLLTLATTQTVWYEGNTPYVLSTPTDSVDFLFFRRVGNNILTWIKKDFGT